MNQDSNNYKQQEVDGNEFTKDNSEFEINQIQPKEIEPISSTGSIDYDNGTGGVGKVKFPQSVDGEGNKKDEVPPQLPSIVPFYKMFRFANKIDYILMFIGSLCSIGNGACLPAISIAFGRLLNVFSPENFKDPNYDLMEQVTNNSLIFVYIGIGAFVCSYFEVAFWMLSGERQAIRCRKVYFKSILTQEIGWYDITKSSELSTRISSDTLLYQEAIGEKVGNFLHHLSTFISGFVIGFIYGWQLTLVIASVTPLLSIAGSLITKMMISITMEGLTSYAKAGGVAEEKIGSIRTVSAFSAERIEANRYSKLLKDALIIGKKKGLMTGLGMGFVFLVLFGIYSLAFWYGGKLIVDKHWNPMPDRYWNGGDVLTVIFSVISGAMALGQASPHISTFASGRGAAYKIYQVIDRKPAANNQFSTDGIQYNNVQGNIQFKNVSFTYPSRPDIQIFNQFNLSIKKGQTIALVGDSGSGKSSCIALLERFYDPNQGEILIDDINIKDINISCLRNHMALVNQDATLFACSIADNIRYANETATIDQIIEACKSANAHDFISQLPLGYETYCGEKGIQLSGGQKQRIAIARALLKNPKILLLDEATSALDSENEYLVQQAIDNLMKDRTTIIIAHRLSTIINSDVIVVIKEGQIIEQGTHNELLALDGAYTELVNKQQQQQNNDNEKKESNDNSNGDGINIQQDKDINELSNNQISNLDSDIKVSIKKKEKSIPFSRILKLSKSDWHYFVFGITASSIIGSSMPIFAIIFSEILKVFQNTDNNELKIGSRNMALWFLLLAVVTGIANFVSSYCFTLIGEKLTFKLRKASFESIIRQEIGYFDLPENTTGKLTTSLATDATIIQSITSQRISLFIQNAVTVIAALVISFIAGWKLTLVVLACVPLLALAGKVQINFLTGFTQKNKESYSDAAQVAQEAIGAIRTVSSFNCCERIVIKFNNCLVKPLQMSIKTSNISGISLGLSNSTLFFIYCLTYWYGGKLISQGEWKASTSTIEQYCIPSNNYNGFGNYDTCVYTLNIAQGYGSMMRIFFAVIMCAMGVGNSLAYAPDYAKAKNSAASIFKFIDKESSIDPFNNKGQVLNQIVGKVEFKNIKFKYPSRPDKVIFNDFNLTIPQGKKVALVGSSGGGKSTCISLLERFYDPNEGEILIDGINIKDINLNCLRGHLSLVHQEPTLHSGTIIDNIRYGKRDATMEEVIEAAKAANAHDFIIEFTEGYNTELGDKFIQLSGGQKQRIAIARAIIRDPKILLLDEATSALDSVSESIVQNALDNVMKGRTTIVIAHRLSTIIDSDIIAVVNDGKIVEIGNHDELLNQNGFYSQLFSRQQINNNQDDK